MEQDYNQDNIRRREEQFEELVWKKQEQEWEVCESRLPHERQTLVGDGNFLCL